MHRLKGIGKKIFLTCLALNYAEFDLMPLNIGGNRDLAMRLDNVLP